MHYLYYIGSGTTMAGRGVKVTWYKFQKFEAVHTTQQVGQGVIEGESEC